MDASLLEDDQSYHRHRVEVETERARSATVPNVVRAHDQRAKAYSGKLASDSPVTVDGS